MNHPTDLKCMTYDAVLVQTVPNLQNRKSTHICKLCQHLCFHNKYVNFGEWESCIFLQRIFESLIVTLCMSHTLRSYYIHNLLGQVPSSRGEGAWALRPHVGQHDAPLAASTGAPPRPEIGALLMHIGHRDTGVAWNDTGVGRNDTGVGRNDTGVEFEGERSPPQY